MQNIKRIKSNLSKYDLSVTLVPLAILLVVVIFLLLVPSTTGSVIDWTRNLLSNELGSYYLVFGLAFVLISLWLAFSKYGKVKLGKGKPKFSTFSWATMIFTSTMAADILFYSLHEWMYYWNYTPLDFNEMTMAEKVTWSESYSLFHWGATPWIFYILPAVAYAYMMHNKKRNRQRISEACRPLLGDKVDGWLGKVIDIISILALLIATSTTFSVATPLLSSAISYVFRIPNTSLLSIIVLVMIAIIYTIAVCTGFKGISQVSNVCVIFFSFLLSIFLIFGDTRFIIENGINSIGNMTQNFLRMSTWTDPTRASSMPQDWTVFYWAYWIAWSIANPFFIAKISEGRTIKNLILGGTLSGVASTFLSFTVFGGYGIAEQASGRIQVAEKLASGASASDVILEIFNTLPCGKLALAILVLAMVGFYASTFDALTHVIASYSHKNISADEEPSKFSKIYWSILFILLPCALLFSSSTVSQLTGISIIAAFPTSILMIIVLISFFKDIKKDTKVSYNVRKDKKV